MTFERAFKRSRRRWPSAWPPPRCGAGLYLILQQRGADMADLPGGASGLLVLDYRGKDADWLVTRTAPGVVSLVAGLRGRERQAAEELASGRPAWRRRVASSEMRRRPVPDPRPTGRRHGRPARRRP